MANINCSELLINASESISYVSDMDTYEILYLNKHAMELLGLNSPDDYQGSTCYRILQGLDSPCPFCTNAHLKENEIYRWEHFNGSVNTWFDVSDTMVCVDNRRLRIEIARDISVRKGNFSSISHKSSVEDILSLCLKTLTRTKDTDAAFRILLEAIGIYYRANRVYIFEFNLENWTLSNTFEWCRPGISQEKDNLQNLPLNLVDYWVNRFETDGEFCINSLEGEVDPDSESYEILKRQNIDSLMAAPLVHNDLIIGFLGVDDPRKNIGHFTLLRSMSEFILIELEKRRLLTELEYLSYTDVLTGLKNRHYYARILQEYELHPPTVLGIVFVNVNGIKNINDTYGYKRGDYVLQRTAQILSDHIPGVCFRSGGDEFVALCEDISQNDFQQAVSNLRSAYDSDDDCSAAIGCVWQSGEINVSEQIHNADELMYAEKQMYYSHVLHEGHSSLRTGAADQVLQEIEDGDFTVYYQPQVELESGRIIGAEALVRKISKDSQLISPNNFIPFYEVEGVIRYVDLFVLENACICLQEWRKLGHILHMSVNFSRITLMEPGIVESIRDICSRYHVPTSFITIEVTESISKIDSGHLQQLVRDLMDAGFSISLDDFGSYYSNLAILSALDFDEIKFDKTLIQDLETNPKSRTVLQNSIRMCQDLPSAHSIAEGIETSHQLELLKEFHCERGQGYFFSKPLPRDEFTLLIRHNHHGM